MNGLLPPEILAGFSALGDALHPLVALFGISNPLQPVVDFMQAVLEQFWEWTGSWGVAIILLTICVRILIFPLTWKQIRSQLAMASLQPKIKELQRKYKTDKAKLQAETMKLYQEYRVNPFASCLPLIVQMPIFICLYWAIRGEEALANAQFLWFTLGKPDPWGVDLGPLYISVLMVIYIVTQLISTELMMTAETPGQQKWLMRAMPLAFAFFLANFASGLFVYWITSNIWTIGQALLVRYMRARHPIELTPENVGKRRESRFMQMMHAAQEQQQAQREGGGNSSSAGRPVKSGQRPPQRPGGKSGARPPGKPGQAGAPPQGKPGAAPAGQRPGKPGAAPAGQRQGAPQGTRPRPAQADQTGRGGTRKPASAPAAEAAPAAQPAPAAEVDGDGQTGGAAKPPSKAIGSRPATRSASGKRPAKPARKRQSGKGS